MATVGRGGAADAVPPAEAERTTLTGAPGGLRAALAERGLSFELSGVHTFQGLTSGGRHGGADTGNLFSGDFVTRLDTGKADLWKGGFLTVRVEGRAGDAVVRRAGTVSPVNNDALLPLNEEQLGEDAWALSEVRFTQSLHPTFALTGGLMNTAGFDASPIAGSLQSNAHFLNTAFLLSPVIVGQVPQASLGGGFVWTPNHHVKAMLLALGTRETAGTDPFEGYEGTTLMGEVDFEYELGGRPGGMGFSAAWSTGQEREAVTTDPRVVLEEILTEGEALTDKDAWSVFWNGFQYVAGDEERGWGFFARAGVSDGDPSPVRFHAAAGIGGTGLLPGRPRDRWGLGIYHQRLSNEGALGLMADGDETGGECFWNIALTPWMRLTFDVQYVDSALPRVGHAVAVASRLAISF